MTPLKIARQSQWQRRGLVLPRSHKPGGHDVAGDPCVVWDEDNGLWRMFLFFSNPGHAQAVSPQSCQEGPKDWEFLGPIPFANPEKLLGGMTHKPFVALYPDGGYRAAKIDGYYQLFCVSFAGTQKLIQRAFSKNLAGPWELEGAPFLAPGAGADFDAKHLDAVSAYYFEKSQELYCFYMGYPNLLQSAQPFSPFGSAQGLARIRRGEKSPQKLGPILRPMAKPEHWASGWIGGLQLFPGTDCPWVALLNASPSAPRLGDARQSGEEPPPSLGGFAYCQMESLDSGWQCADEPLERIEAIPQSALLAGEGTNLWRHFLLRLDNGRQILYYNSGSYGQEQLYAKEASV
jgi:hypothetical protein